jgi:hypothetical protein
MKDKIDIINKGIDLYFKSAKTDTCKSKDLIPTLINLTLFEKDNRKGNPLRTILRQLQKENKLDLIPKLIAVKKKKNTYWTFSNTRKK